MFTYNFWTPFGLRTISVPAFDRRGDVFVYRGEPWLPANVARAKAALVALYEQNDPPLHAEDEVQWTGTAIEV